MTVPSSGLRSFLWLSDIHLDLWYASSEAVDYSSEKGVCRNNTSKYKYPVGHAGCDAAPSMFRQLLLHAKRQLKGRRPDFVLLTGDLCRHGTAKMEDPIGKLELTLESVASEIVETIFPVVADESAKSLNIIPSLGNNDVTPDYYLDVSNHSFASGLQVAARAMDQLFDHPSELELFARGGYFARTVNDFLTVISLNTIIYSSKHSPNQTSVIDPLGQFAWLEEELQKARQTSRKIYIASHIPPTVGSYRHTQLWHDRYLIQYNHLLATYHDVVMAQFYGHVHSEEFRVIESSSNIVGAATTTTTIVPLYVTSAVTPVYQNNPTYRIVHYVDPEYNDNIVIDDDTWCDDDDTWCKDDDEPDYEQPKERLELGSILDYESYFFDLDAFNQIKQHTNVSTELLPYWKTFLSFRLAYNVPDATVPSLQRILQDLKNKNTTMDTFLHRLYSNGTTTNYVCDESCRRDWYCTLQASTKRDYLDCLAFSNPFEEQIITVVVALLLFLALSLGITTWISSRIMNRHKQRLYQAAHVMDDDDHTFPYDDDEEEHNAIPQIT